MNRCFLTAVVMTVSISAAAALLCAPPASAEKGVALKKAIPSETGPRPAAAGTNLTLLNTYRAQNSLPALVKNAALVRAANGYSRHLAKTNKDGHAADGRSIDARIKAAGYSAPCYWAENVYTHPSATPLSYDDLAKVAFDGWRNSPGHNAHMLSQKARDVGVWFWVEKHNGQYIYKAVQNFASKC